jgi:hypothetical protein
MLMLNLKCILRLAGASFFCMCTIHAENLLVGKLVEIFVISLKPSKNVRENQQMQQLFIHFINYV